MSEAELPVLPSETASPAQTSSASFLQKYRRQLIVAGILAVVIVGGIAIALVLRNRGASEANFQTDGRFSFLPANTCPERIFIENGVARADYKGDPYAVKDKVAQDWINQNCPDNQGIQRNNPENNSPTGTDSNGNSTGSNSNGNNVANNGNSGNNPGGSPNQQQTETEPPLKLKSVGFNFGMYNAQTHTAGDMVFTQTPLPFNQIYSPYGQQDPRTTDTSKRNPQPVFILPIGTKVQAIVTGEVIAVNQLYSGDTTIHIATNKESQWIYEMEHVKNATVQVGDKVTAGQVIAEVSDYDSHNNPGFGLLEIGILHAGVTAEHVCPFKYLDSSVKADINAKISALYTGWEAYLGQNIYDEGNFVSPGCVVEAAVKD